MGERKDKMDTQLIHAGEPRPRLFGSAVVPIFQGTVYEVGEGMEYGDIPYIRLNNLPNHKVLADKLAALEGAEAGVVAASGMAAISTALLGLLQAGDHLLAHSCLYGGTHTLVTHDLPALGIQSDFIDGCAPESWEQMLRPNTRAIYVEAMSNPLLDVADLQAAVAFAQSHGLISIIDNTFASPINFRPAEWGFDLSLHSATKYLNGHSDLVAGAAIGRADLIDKITHKLNHFGGSLDPHACFLLHRGVKTLALRVRHQNASTLALAEALEADPRVRSVRYPGLPSHPQHARAQALFDGCGGVVSFELGGSAETAQRFIDHTRLTVCGPSLGGVETLITRPATTSHSSMSAEERETSGITDTLIRVAVGIEDPDDLIADFQQALDAIG